MEKSVYNPNYPQMPEQMTSSAANEDMKNYPAPPSYDQATGSGATAATPYPPVQVLPTQPAGWAANVQQQQPQPQPHQHSQPSRSQPSYPTHRHNPPTVNMAPTQYPTYQGVPTVIIQRKYNISSIKTVVSSSKFRRHFLIRYFEVKKVSPEFSFGDVVIGYG